MASASSTKIHAHLPLSGEGADARAAASAPSSTPAQTLPADRLYAIENGPSGFDPAAPRLLPKIRFLMLMKNERLAHAAHRVRRSEPHADDRYERPRGRRAAICAPRRAAPRSSNSSPAICSDELRGPPQGAARAGPQLLGRRQEGGVDHQSRLGRGARGRGRRAGRSAALSRQCLCRPAGRPGASSICSGRRSRSDRSARLKIVKRIVRCAATNVDPDTGIRDLAIPDDADAELSATPTAASMAR